MRFERIQIEGFGPIVGLDVTLEPRKLNLIIGPNESGKSSLASAVVSTLFGFSSAEEEQRARPWNGAPHRASITFEIGGSRHRVRRDFQSHEVHVERLTPAGEEAESMLFRGVANPRGRGPELQQYEELLRGWFGFTDPHLFSESCFVHSNALQVKVSPELRHLVSGAVEADYQEIQKALLTRLDALTREHPFDPRMRKRTNRSIENRQAKLEELRERRIRSEYVLRELKSASAEHSAAESRIKEFQAGLFTKEHLLLDLDTLLKLREEQRKLLKRGPAIGEELVRARRARLRVDEIGRKISGTLAYLTNAPEEVEGDLVRLGILRSQCARHLKTAETERKRFEESRAPSLALALIAGCVLGVIIGAVVFGVTKSAIATAVAGVAGFTAGTLGLSLMGRSATRGRSLAEAKVRVADENLRTLNQEVGAIEIRLEPFLRGRTLEMVLADVKQLRALDNERREHAAVVHSLHAPERLEAESREIDDAVNVLRAKEKLLVAQTPLLASLRDDPVRAAEAVDRLKREANGLKVKIEAERDSMERSQRRPGSAEGDAENLEALEEAIVDEEEALRREERQRDALLMALDALRESVTAYQEEHVGRLATLAGATLAQLTGGRYSKVTLDAELNPTVGTNGREDVPVDSLSHGARDAFYFALRSALVRELAAREPLPLLLDDPSAHLDEERRGTLVGYLEGLTQDLQVILLTHDRRILNQVREVHLVTIGTESYATGSNRKIQVRA